MTDERRIRAGAPLWVRPHGPGNWHLFGWVGQPGNRWIDSRGPVCGFVPKRGWDWTDWTSPSPPDLPLRACARCLALGLDR